MGRVLSHVEIEELLGAFALDATDPIEADLIQSHLPECPRCRAEVAQYREVAAALGNRGTEASKDLWDRIAGSLVESPPPLRMAPVIGGASTSRRRYVSADGKRGLGYRATAGLVAAAAVIIGVLVVQVSHLNSRVNSITPVVADHGLQQAATAALLNPHGRRVQLASGTNPRSAQVVLLPSGAGFLVNSHLPALAPGMTYQLWALMGTTKVSLGLLGSNPTDVAFNVGEDAKPTILMVTAEQAGGVTVSNHPAVVWGSVPLSG
ncbi:MAG: anti-sigma factor [Acidimicrobiales bacterium]